MSWSSLQVGRLALRENYDLAHQVNATTGEQSVSITGMESSPPLTEAEVRARQEDLIGLYEVPVPVVFGSKDNHNGFYTVSDLGSALTKWDEAEYFGWSLSMKRIGTDNTVDFESRLANVVRQNDFLLLGERWHAPPYSAYAYVTGDSAPSSMTRYLASGEPLKVYRGIPEGFNPTWGCDAEDYLTGRVMFLNRGVERSGTGINVDVSFWKLDNGLVSVRPYNGTGLRVESWDGVSTSAQSTSFTANSSVLSTFESWDSVSVIRNDFECVVVRCVYGIAAGRVMLDVTLRRGSRIVECFLQCNVVGTMGAKTFASLTTTNNAASGYIVASGDDSEGNRFVLGSARTFTGSTTGAISKAAVTTFGFFMGHEINGASAVSGDAATDLRNQYIGTAAEQVLAVKR